MSSRGANSGAVGVSETTESGHHPSLRRLHFLGLKQAGVGGDSSRPHGRARPELQTSVDLPLVDTSAAEIFCKPGWAQKCF